MSRTDGARGERREAGAGAGAPPAGPPGRDVPPRPGDGAQHDAEGADGERGEDGQVEETLHAVVAHAHQRVQVVLAGEGGGGDERSEVRGQRSHACTQNKG